MSKMSGESSNLATNLKDNLTIVTFPSTLKLTSTNYLGWKTQVEALLQGLDLYRFIDGTHLAPEPTTAPDGSKPLSSYHPSNHKAASSLDAWKTLASTYASPSRGHIKQLQYRLKQLTKRSDQTITDYMQNVKTIVDELAILGKKMDAEDITDAVLHGLDQTMYKPTLDAIHARDSPISFNELHEKLINQELSLAQQITPTNIHQPASVFFAHHQSNRKSWPPRQDNNSTGLLPAPSVTTGQRPFLGKCQWCHQKGHSLNNCYTFKKVNPTISVPPYKNFQVKGAQVHTMTPQQISSSNGNWIFDSGATFHATNDLNNLSMHAPYDGTKELVIGDVNLDDWLPLSVPVITPTDPTPSHPPSTPTHSNTSPTQSPTSNSYSAAPIHNFDTPQSPIQQHSDPDPSLTNSSAASTPSPPTKMTTRPHPKPNSKYYNSSFQLYTATTSPSSEPTNITQALKNPAWRNAMQDKFNALDRNKTWSLGNRHI
ncbi:hypothetical protein LXL04_028043 [Taraxacum kok-saghyz]